MKYTSDEMAGCALCGKEFKPGVSRRGPTAQKYCSAACRSRAWLNRPPPAALVPRTCRAEGCKNEVKPSRAWQSYCSSKCKRRAAYLRRREELEAEREKAGTKPPRPRVLAARLSWRKRQLGELEWRVLEILVDAYPEAVTVERLAELCEVTPDKLRRAIYQERRFIGDAEEVTSAPDGLAFRATDDLMGESCAFTPTP